MINLGFKYAYHCHTERCGHCTAADEELVKAAIHQGVKTLCFTDHTPIPFFSQPGGRMEMPQIDEYINSITSLKEKYKNQIEIHVALEAENFPGNNFYLKDFLKNKGIEYLIIGQHIILLNNQTVALFDPKFPLKERINTYVDSIVDALDSGLSKYVAHPDILICFLQSFDEQVEKAMRRIVECAIKNNAYLEFNIHGVWNCNLSEYGYPNKRFWEMVKNDYPNAKITIGLDIHHLSEIDDSVWLVKGLELVKEIGLNITNAINIEKELK